MASHLKNLSDFSHTTVPTAGPYKFGIVVAAWNAEVTGKLYNGAYESLLKYGTREENIISVEVAGSYELIAAADILLTSKELDAVICLGCVIQGETRHFDFICDAVGHGLANVGLKHTKPVIFGVLTTDNQEQALDRAGGKHGNKGDEAAITAIKMADMASKLK
ncbi:6,7-dimethyl-8-ribityllumazine synthase [Pseudopedobacter saltans DSM 12145]|uniref:6,7-dimethyl-8-ribityllumazine synthase n=1 Tax=Pseudopedobacter saltans (strain ATCC 51119 / DSM 12145 / JCM 21818 / CCUG 39354 / LMG 10337 / NBRC 100064 / NCIMB 13643) TaxID=762903 RepID=F0S679_PSESL|nr:6,7-dimethyl-8-ribityllumazine synthase [Pseudopedobacter saltans]ADY53193.1 6,7-dimethyl-8-ribityllumazine synthase [Pseudopedobacter saltans DSM 12145]